MRSSGWATSLDRALAGSRYVVLVGEVDVPGPDALRGALATLASNRRYARITFEPRPHRSIWRSAHIAPPPLRSLPEHVVAGGATAMLRHIRRSPGLRRPLEVHASSRFIAIDVDHGLGDGQFVLELFAEILGVAVGRTVQRPSSANRRAALPLALAKTFGMHPCRAAAAKRRFEGLRTSRDDAAPAAGRPAASHQEPSYAVALAHVDAATDAAVTNWRRTHTDGAGSSAVWLHIALRALESAGLVISDRAMIAFDCRRYLPRRGRFDGNFAMGVEIPIPRGAGPDSLARRIDGCVATAVPLAAMGVLAARTAVSSRNESAPDTPRPNDGRIALTYTEISRITALDALPWSGPSRFFTGLLDPSSPNALTVFNTRVGACRKVSISFHDNHIDSRSIEQATRSLEDPMQFLPSTAAVSQQMPFER